MNKYDVIIIGGGILGISHAYHCLKAGLKVALVEKNQYNQAATVRNFGQIVPSGFDNKWQQFGRESLRIYQHLQEEANIGVRQEGTVYLASDQEEMGLLEELAEINRNHDYTSVLLNKESCLKRYPRLKSTYVKGGLYFPEEIIVDPRHAARRIIEYLVQAHDLVYIPNTCVKAVNKFNDTVTITTSALEKYQASKVILCSGTEFQILFPEIFEASDLHLVKLQMMDTLPMKNIRIEGSVLTGWTIRRYESFQECPSYASVKAKEDEHSFYKKNGIHILFKQSPDGSIIIGDSHHYAPVNEIETLSFDTDNSINCFMLSQAQRIFDFDDWTIRRTWLGYYCQCAERDIFKETIDEDIHIITGIGGKGMTGAPGYARQNVEQLFSINQTTSY